MIRFFTMLVLVGMLAWCGATVQLGKRTFFGHISAIWNTEEAQDMKKGVEEKAGPVVKDMKEGVKENAGPAAEKLKRGVEAGYREATRDEKAPVPGAGTATGTD